MSEEALLLLLMALKLEVPPLGMMFAVLIGQGGSEPHRHTRQEGADL